jgi:tetratricopeptide (TPR) repeat protein
MGCVFLARRASDGAEVAVKLIPRETSPATLARFERETRLLALLGERAGFVPLLDYCCGSDYVPYLVMPFIGGGTLRNRLARGPLSVEETLALGRALARALGRAHARGIVHRDVKPENVLFTARGRPLLADLGLAKHFDRSVCGASQSIRLTASGIFKGTAGYMAPEQMRDAACAGPAADVFALGAVLYECLAGRPAFASDTLLEVLARVDRAQVAPLRRDDVPPSLEAALRRALARDPRERFADGAAFARALGAAEEAPLPGRGLKTALVAGGVAALALLALGVTARAGTQPESRTAVAASTALPRSDRERAVECEKRGFARMAAGDLDEGIALCTKAITLAPDLAQAWLDRGYAKAFKGDMAAAERDWSRAIQLDPKLTAAWSDRAIARALKNDWPGAIADGTRAIELDPGDASAWARRAEAREKAGDDWAAFADWSKVIELDPTNAQAWGARGRLKLASGDLDGAIADSTKAIELDPGLGFTWRNRGLARGRKGDTEGAIADCVKAAELSRDPSR